MKKIFVLLCFAFMSVLLFAQAEYVVCYDNVKIHTTTDLNGPISGELQKNDVVKVLKSSGEWAVIDHKGSVGYVLKYFLREIDNADTMAVKVDTVPDAKLDTVIQIVYKTDTLYMPDTVAKPDTLVDTVKTLSVNERLKKALNFNGIALNYCFFETKDDADGFPSKLNGFTAGFFGQGVLYEYFVALYGVSYQFGVSAVGAAAGNPIWFYHNFKVPLKLGVSFPFGNKCLVSLFFGPSLDFNVSTRQNITYNSNYKTSIDYVLGKYEQNYGSKKYSETKSDYKALDFFDVPIGVGAIFKCGHVGLKFEYEWGMLNRYNSTYKNNYSLKINQLSVGLIVAF